MINFTLWLLSGALVGWLASLIMRLSAQQGALLNIIVGIIGAFLGGIIFRALGFGGPDFDNSINFPALVISWIGAVVLIAIINFFKFLRRGSVG